MLVSPAQPRALVTEGRPTPGFEAASAAIKAFGADLAHLGAVGVDVDQTSVAPAVQLRFADDYARAVAASIVRPTVDAPTGAADAFRGVQLLVGDAVPTLAPSHTYVTQLLGQLDGVSNAQYLGALGMYSVGTRDQASADRLQALLRSQINGADVVVAPDREIFVASA